jgi:hypothetical protein
MCGSLLSPLLRPFLHKVQDERGSVRDSPGVALLTDRPFAWNRRPTSPTSDGKGAHVPKFKFAEFDPKATTLYFEINVGQGSPSPGETGVFIPPGFKAAGGVDLILYLHGHGSQGTIFRHWSAAYPYQFRFRHYLSSTKKNAILVAPSLGQTSEAPSLEAKGGGDKYLDEVMEGLDAEGPLKGTSPSVGNIIVAAHSGGGIRMLNLVTAGFQAYAGKVRECWGYDCTYNAGVGQGFFSWASGHPDTQVFVYYIAGTGTEAEAKILDRLARQAWQPNIHVTASSTDDHYRVPVRYFSGRVRETSVLQSR